MIRGKVATAALPEEYGVHLLNGFRHFQTTLASIEVEHMKNGTNWVHQANSHFSNSQRQQDQGI